MIPHGSVCVCVWVRKLRSCKQGEEKDVESIKAVPTKCPGMKHHDPGAVDCFAHGPNYIIYVGLNILPMWGLHGRGISSMRTWTLRILSQHGALLGSDDKSSFQLKKLRDPMQKSWTRSPSQTLKPKAPKPSQTPKLPKP